MSLIAKLKRRNVFRSALAYAVLAWLLVEVMELITDTFGAPDWVLQVFVSVAVIGIVPVMVFSWLYEITPDGIRREGTGDVDHSADTTHKLNVAIVVMLAIAIGLFAWQQFAGGEGAAPETAQIDPKSTPVGEIARSGETLDSDLAPMVAALPFASVSLDGESDFFAVGVHDDLLTQLAKMESMRVISRTSVLEYKDTTRNIRDIGDALGADVILEGGVQAAGGRIRINAQLIDAETDEHLWAETYDREMTTENIFDVQREIAGAIAAALNTTLTVQDDRQLREIPTDNLAAYRAYHEALDIWNERRKYDNWEAAYGNALRKAIELDPEYVRPRAELVGIIALNQVGSIETDPAVAAEAEHELEVIRRLASDSAEYLIAQAYYIYYILRDYPHAHEVVVQALSRNPSDIKVLQLKSWIERRLQIWDTRLETLREIQRLDPRNENHELALIYNLILMHRYDDAVEALAGTEVEHINIDEFRALMRFREDGDRARFLDSMRDLYERKPDIFADQLTYTLLLNREYDEALRLQGAFNPDDFTPDARHFPGEGWRGLHISWILDDQEGLARYIQAAEAFLEERRDGQGNIVDIRDFGLLGLVAAVKGDREAAIEAVENWEDTVVDDPAQYLDGGPVSCEILGMVGDAARASRCLRRYLKQPSYALPFIDPYMPFFDPVRNEPEFQALLADIEAGEYH